MRDSRRAKLFFILSENGLSFWTKDGIKKRIANIACMAPVPKADAPSVKIAKFLKFASQKLVKMWVKKHCMKHSRHETLIDLACFNAI